VQCTDLPCGESTDVIINPVTKTVTHFALKDKKLPGNPTRLVPIDKVASATHDRITLNCTRDEVARMRPFIVTNFVPQAGTGQDFAAGSFYASSYAISDASDAQYKVGNKGYAGVNEEQVPRGERSVTAGMKIEASDGKVGTLDELVLDPNSGEITHIQMREGHLWGKKDVAIPIEEVDFADADTVYLKIDKAAVKTLPAVKVKR
jgi:sporulation protein YlmC with PRC-barrel domain